MTHSLTPPKPNQTSPKPSLKQRLSNKISSLIVGKKVQVSTFPPMAIAGCAIYWYFENGVRQFLMIKDINDKENKARFVSHLGLGENADMTTASLNITDRLLGKVFTRALDKKLLEQDRVCAIPTFHAMDSTLNTRVPVPTLIWAVQITSDQANLCEPLEGNIEVVAVPEFAMMGQEVSPSHQALYQSALRHIHASNPLMQDMGLEQLDDFMQNAPRSNAKIVH